MVNVFFFFLYFLSVAEDKPVSLYTEVKSTQAVAASMQTVQQRVTITDKRWEEANVRQKRPPPPVRKVDDDWHILLDKAAKTPGIITLYCTSVNFM